MKSTSQNNSINAINNVRTLLNELRGNTSPEETKRIRKKLYEKEAAYNFLKEKDSLTNKEKNVLKNIDRYPKNISKHLKNLKKHFKKLHKYEHNTTHGLDYLFNEHNEEGRITESPNNDNNVFKEATELLNERRSNLLHKETKRIRKKLRRIEAVYNVLKEK